jgi:cytochrome c oxidase subunit 2
VVSTRSDFSNVWGLYLWLGVGIAVFIFAFVGFALVRYRARAGAEPSQRDEHNTLEIGAALLLVAIIALLVFVTFHTEGKEDDPTAADAVTIHVVAFQWGWRFSYPGQGVTVVGNSNHQPNFAVPVGRPVDFSLTSTDVIHAMWIPEQRFKKDAIPGKTNRFAMEFDSAGHEVGHCSEYCGLRHTNMGFGVWVLSDGSYERWLAAHR